MEVVMMDGWMVEEGCQQEMTAVIHLWEGSIVVDDHRKEPRGSKTQTQSVQWQFTCLGSCHGPCLCVSISET